MVMENKTGLMVQSIRDNGKITKLTVKEHFGMFMAINTKEHGKKIKLMAKVFTLIVMVQPTTVLGSMICNMDLVKNRGMIVQHMKVITQRD
jgi:hypothetical protein